MTDMARTVRHLVWDWNGTLFHDVDAVATATSAVLAGFDLNPITADDHRSLFTRPVWVFYERLLGRPLVEGEFERLSATFRATYATLVEGCDLAPDARQTLRSFRTGGRTQSLLSMTRHDELLPLVSGLGIYPEFVRVDGLRGKAGGLKAEHLVAHLEVIGEDGADTLVVGDSVDDADAAAHVGARCVLYSQGHASRAALAEAGVPIVDTLTEALRYA